METTTTELDVLCIGMACVDLAFAVDHHPRPNEKMRAKEMLVAGGGPASNAAVCVSRLGGKAGFAGAVGKDSFGDEHLKELVAERVDTRWVSQSDAFATSVAAVLTKPDGQRSVVNHGGAILERFANSIDTASARVILLDGHQPVLSELAIDRLGRHGVISVLDAGSAHPGTRRLAEQVDYLVASSAFAKAVAKTTNRSEQIESLSRLCPNVVVTDGENGLAWKTPSDAGQLSAIDVDVIDETGAGDAFHGGFAVAMARGMAWGETLEFASACGALACTRMGARASMPTANEVQQLLVAKSRR